MEKLTITGTLPIGVVIAGKLCNAVTLREATFREGLKAANTPNDDVEFYPKLASIASCLTIEGIAPELITHDFILDLDEEDGEYLMSLKAQLTLKKKEQVQAAISLTQ